jgi:hypothetical protein
MIAIIRRTLPGGAGRADVPVRKLPQTLVMAPQLISCRGNVLQFFPTPTAMFVTLPIDTPQMLRAADLARSGEGAHGARACCLPQFPVRPV